ncbi:MAG: hypothetical protein GY701_34515 [Sulfitobacter sp.]|nr:hypothetical protein [Sulfitobacter sp.]
MGELTVPQPLATLAVMSAVKVLVVAEPPLCHACGGSGEHWSCEMGSAVWDDCTDCGDGLARWPAEVPIRSTTKEPEITNSGAWDVWRHMDGEFALVRDRHFVQFLPLGHVVGAVTVEAAVPIVNSWPTRSDPFCVYAGEDYAASAFIPGNDGDITEALDLTAQLAFQDFPVGHTALILGGESDG